MPLAMPYYGKCARLRAVEVLQSDYISISSPNSMSDANKDELNHGKRAHWTELRSLAPEKKYQFQAKNRPSLFSYRKFRMILLMIIECIVSVCFGMHICACGVLNTMNIRNFLEYPCGFQTYVCFGSFFIFPLLLLLSFWKKAISVTRYGFLIIGSLFIMSGVSIIATCVAYLGVHNTFIYLAFGGFPFSEYSSLLLMMLVSIWGGDSILRYWCCGKYNHALFVFSLFRSYEQSSRDFWKLSVALGIYITICVVGWCILIAHSLQG